ncbi:MAG: hypothetical protein AAFV29_22830, partial [Myxococcota bacterium]
PKTSTESCTGHNCSIVVQAGAYGTVTARCSASSSPSTTIAMRYRNAGGSWILLNTPIQINNQLIALEATFTPPAGQAAIEIECYTGAASCRWNECLAASSISASGGFPSGTCSAYCSSIGRTCQNHCSTNQGLPNWGTEAWLTEAACQDYDHSPSGGQVGCSIPLTNYGNVNTKKYRCCCR